MFVRFHGLVICVQNVYKFLRDFADLMIRMIYVLSPFAVHRFSKLMRINDECIFSTGSLRKFVDLLMNKVL